MCRDKVYGKSQCVELRCTISPNVQSKSAQLVPVSVVREKTFLQDKHVRRLAVFGEGRVCGKP